MGKEFKMSDKFNTFLSPWYNHSDEFKDSKSAFFKLLEEIMKKGQVLLASKMLTGSEAVFVSSVLIDIQREKELLEEREFHTMNRTPAKPGL
jgi:hypothetical protein